MKDPTCLDRSGELGTHRRLFSLEDAILLYLGGKSVIRKSYKSVTLVLVLMVGLPAVGFAAGETEASAAGLAQTSRFVESEPTLRLPFTDKPLSLVAQEDPTPLYARPPSDWFANLFNEKVGTTEPNQVFLVEEARTLPSITGDQLWIMVTPADGDSNSPCFNGCWLLLGTVRNPLQVDAPNFEAYGLK